MSISTEAKSLPATLPGADDASSTASESSTQSSRCQIVTEAYTDAMNALEDVTKTPFTKNEALCLGKIAALHIIGGSLLSLINVIKSLANIVLSLGCCNMGAALEDVNELARNIIRSVPVVGITLTHGFDAAEKYISEKCASKSTGAQPDDEHPACPAPPEPAVVPSDV